MSDFANLLLEVDGPLAIITINRPKALNALNAHTLDELDRALDEVAQSGVRALAITGSGDRAFVAGADIVAMQGMSPSEAAGFALKGHAVFNKIEALPFPVIAAVNGFALGGGCELAMACDLIYANNHAQFGQPEVGLGVIPGFGGTLRLVRHVGLQRARDLIFSGRRIKAREAEDYGLVARVVEAENLLPACREFAQGLVTKGPAAIAAAKRVMLEALDLPFAEAVKHEATAFGGLFETPEQAEGMAAFIERRKPDYSTT